MPNAFSKEERVTFEDVLEGFNDALVMSSNVEIYNTDSTSMERQSDTIWRPMPYIALSYDGMDQSSNFTDYTQLSVPATLGYQKSVPLSLDGKELRDALQQRSLGKAAYQKLASDINTAVTTVASYQGSIFVKRNGAASGWDDVAACEASMNELGVPMGDRFAAYSTRDYNGMASNLAGRQTLTAGGKTQTAYEKSYIGEVAGFSTFKMDTALRLAVATGTGTTINEATAANRRYIPKAKTTTVAGQVNQDNRYMTITVAGANVATIKAGDAFTIAGVNSVHPITKADTGQLKTFRVISTAGGGTSLTFSPPIIAADSSPTKAELEYKNVTATPANGAAITFLNTAAGYLNPFWHKSSIVLMPGSLAFPSAGAEILRGKTDQGLEVVMSKQFDLKTGKTNYRWDTLFGVANLNPEMNGVEMFSQP